MKYLRQLSRVIIGLVFVFSGFVKGVDPLGSTYKFQDYFHAFGIGFFDFLALPLAVFLCTAEFIAGLSVLTGFRIRYGIYIVSILMLIFTPLTLVLAISNPVSDCGCFGDAVHLTNWQTFWKNIILLVPAIILFVSARKFQPVLAPLKEWPALILFTFLFVFFCIINLRYLPVMDFLPYKKGVYIPEKMIVPEGKAPDVYETTFLYEKDGVLKEFTIDNYPVDDTTWRFVDQKSVLRKKGYEPPIHDFSFTTMESEDITDRLLTDESYTLLMIVKKLEKAKQELLMKGYETGRFCLENGINFYILTSSSSSEIKHFKNEFTICTGDEVTLKSMVRADPGYMLIKEGTITGKWSWANLPDKEWFTGNIAGKQIRTLDNRLSIVTVISAGLVTIIVYLLVILSQVGKVRKEL